MLSIVFDKNMAKFIVPKHYKINIERATPLLLKKAASKSLFLNKKKVCFLQKREIFNFSRNEKTRAFDCSGFPFKHVEFYFSIFFTYNIVPLNSL